LFAAVANSIAVTDPIQARKLGNASIGLSIVGIIISVLLFVILFVMLPYAFAMSELSLTNLA